MKLFWLKNNQEKTASLIDSACAAGAASAAASDSDTEKMKLLGEKIGIAFQIRDDLFDFGDGDAGKPQGNVINSPGIAYTRQKNERIQR